MSVKSDSLEHTKELLKDWDLTDKNTHVQLGSFDVTKDYKDTEAYKSLKWVTENRTGKLKQVKWGDMTKLIKEQKFLGWNKLQSHSWAYHYFLSKGYTAPPENPKPGIAGMDFKNSNDEYQKIEEFTNSKLSEQQDSSLNAVYYHGAKAHWLVDGIRKEGLWNAIQGTVATAGMNSRDERMYQLSIHPGSVRSGVFETMDDPDLDLWIWDDYDAIPLPETSIDEMIDEMKSQLVERNADHYSMSFSFTRGYLEIHSDLLKMNFRGDVTDFNKKVNKLSAGKPLTIYVGYDSRHKDIAELSAKCLKSSILFGAGHGDVHDVLGDWTPEIKFLDISKIPEYNREYAAQSTEFTYSRFLIPYLENYEGFSIFIDDDILFNESILPMFYYLDLDDAVACVQYDFDTYAETKFNGEKNVSYPKKLWSSLMIFNNGHEDCKKLTPEVINTESGKYLHQFEWTDKISEIPEWYVITEGHDTQEEKWRACAIHYTRGGPWIEGMDTSEIEHLNMYERFKNKHQN